MSYRPRPLCCLVLGSLEIAHDHSRTRLSSRKLRAGDPKRAPLSLDDGRLTRVTICISLFCKQLQLCPAAQLRGGIPVVPGTGIPGSAVSATQLAGLTRPRRIARFDAQFHRELIHGEEQFVDLEIRDFKQANPLSIRIMKMFHNSLHIRTPFCADRNRNPHHAKGAGLLYNVKRSLLFMIREAAEDS